MAQKGTFKVGINNLVSWGASIVIIGLMAKLQHWPWGDWMIVVGLGTEAVLFFILGFQKETTEEPAEVVVPVQRGQEGATVALDNMLQQADIDAALIGRLGDGLRQFSTKVEAMSSVSDASIATKNYTETLNNATQGFARLNTAFEKASADLETLGATRQDSQAYQKQISKLAGNLKSLNQVYEEELREADQKMRAMMVHYESIAQTLKDFNDSASDTQQLKEQLGVLNKNLASLNAVYGNMLVAMNQPRV